MPIEYAIPKVHKFLVEEGIRENVTIVASGGIRTPHDMAKIIALGADAVCLGTADLVALECLRCHHCESGRGCARGIATTDDELTGLMNVEWGTQRIINLYLAWRTHLTRLLARLGMKSVTELVGRTDALVHIDYMKPDEIDGSWIKCSAACSRAFKQAHAQRRGGRLHPADAGGGGAEPQ